MKKILNLFLITILIYGCHTPIRQSYQKAKHLAKPTKIAIILPLSHERGKIGNMINDFIQLGLSYGSKYNQTSANNLVLNQHDSQIQITNYDIASGIEEVGDQLLIDKPDIVLGPIFSRDTKKIARKLLNTDTIIISLSNDSSIAKNQVYTFGILPIEQIKQMCSYLKSQDIRNIILLAPDTQESQQWINAVSLVARKNQMNIVESRIYQSHIQSIQNIVEQISTTVDQLNEDVDNPSKVAIYLPNDPNLALVFDSLTNYQLDKKAIICGNNQSNVKYDHAIDIIFTEARYDEKFSTELINAFSSDQSIKAAQLIAFDLGLITSYAVGTDEFNKIVFESKLSDQNGYKGLTGLIQMHNNYAKRKYQIIHRHGSSYKILDR